MKPSIQAGAYLVLLLTLPLSLLFGQPFCNENYTKKPKNSLDYQSRGNRCEGFYIPKLSSQQINIVSALFGRLVYALEEDEVVKIYREDNLVNLPVQVSAVGLPLRMYYRMDSEIGDKDTLFWDVKSVLLKEEINYRDIGIAGRVMKEGRSWIIPLKTEASISNLYSDEKLRIKFRANCHLENIKYRWYDMASSQPSKKWESIPEGVYWSGEPIVIVFPPDNKFPSKMVVEIVGDNLNGKEEVRMKSFILTHN